MSARIESGPNYIRRRVTALASAVVLGGLAWTAFTGEEEVRGPEAPAIVCADLYASRAINTNNGLVSDDTVSGIIASEATNIPADMTYKDIADSGLPVIDMVSTVDGTHSIDEDLPRPVRDGDIVITPTSCEWNQTQ